MKKGKCGAKYNKGHIVIHLHSGLHIEHVRTCRHCGCTEYDACTLLAEGPCHWVSEQVCSSPFCIALETAHAEKETTHADP